MKIAYLIIVHKDPEQLFRLIRALIYKDEEFFIHIDKKCDIKPFVDSLSLLKDQRVHLIKDRQAVRLAGSYSHTESIVKSLLEIFSKPCDFDYLILLSGQDYPIKSNELIHAFLNKNKGKEFVEHMSLLTFRGDEMKGRLRRYTGYFFYEFGLMGRFLNLAGRLLPRKQFPKGYAPYYGSTYWRITRECAAFLVEFINKNPKFMHFFRFSYCSDECLFQTIVLNSPFGTNVVNSSLTYLDWSTGLHPKVLTHENFNKLRDSDALFARKFDIYKDSKVLDLIDVKLLREDLKASH